MTTREGQRVAHSAIEALPRADEWSALGGPAGFYQSHAWLRAVERASPPGTVYYVCGRDETGVLLGVLPAYLFPAGAGAGLYEPALFLDAHALESLGDDRPLLLLGGRAGYVTGWCLRRDGEPGARRAVLRALLASGHRLADQLGAGLVAVEYLAEDDVALLVETGFAARGEVAVHSFGATVVDVPSAFEDYVASLPSSRRSTVRRDLHRFADAGCSTEISRLSEVLDVAPALLAQVQAKHGQPADIAFLRTVLEAQRAELDDFSVACLARDAEREPVSFSVSYVCGTQLAVRLVGLRHADAERSAAYFHCAYYEPISYACRHGLVSVHLGIGSMRPKLLRGARCEPLYGVWLGGGGARLDREMTVGVEERARAELVADAGPLAGAWSKASPPVGATPT